MKTRTIVIVVALAAIAIGGGTWFWVGHRSVPTASHNLSSAPLALPAVLKAVAAPDPAAEEQARFQTQLALAIPHKGNGVENPFIQQLIATPELQAGLGFRGDASNKVAVRKWAEGEAHRIACKTGFYDRDLGREIRVIQPEKTAYFLKLNGKGGVQVIRYDVSAGTSSPQPVHIDKVRSASPDFQDWTGHADLSTYEYLYTGQR